MAKTVVAEVKIDLEKVIQEVSADLKNFFKVEPEIAMARIDHCDPNDPSEVKEVSDFGQDLYVKSVVYSPNLDKALGEAFRGLASNYYIPAKLQKKVEVATRKYYKARRTPKPKSLYPLDRAKEKVRIYAKVREELMMDTALLKVVLQQGKPHSESTLVKVGPFTLINAGNFDEKVMGTVADLMGKAVSAMKTHGFDKALYGTIQIVGNLNSKTLAHYDITHDDLYVRADAKVGTALRTILHELGHRWGFKFLSKGVAKALYRTMAHEESGRKMSLGELKDLMPKPGDIVKIKNEEFVFLTISPKGNGSGYWMILTLSDDSKSKVRIDLMEYLKSIAPPDVRSPSKEDHVGFVTNYAKKDEDENFAEMFSFYCLDELNEAQKKLFEDACFNRSYQR